MTWQKKTHPVKDGQTNRSSGNEAEVHRSYQDRAFHASEALLFTKFPDSLWAKFRTPSHAFVMLRILKNCGFDGSGVCFENQKSMAVACCCCVRKLSTLINELEMEGFIKVNRQLKQTNRITLTAKTLSYMENIEVIGKVCRQKR